MGENGSDELMRVGAENAIRNWLHPIGKFITSHPGVSLTILFGYLTFLGYVYLVFLLKHFGLNGSHFVQINDLLLIFARSVPAILGLLIIHALMAVKDMIFFYWHAPGESFRERLKNLLRVSVVVEVFLLVFLLPGLSGIAGNLKAVWIETKGDCVVLPSRIASQLGISQNVKIIESTSQYVFFLTDEKKAIVADKNSVLPLEACTEEAQNDQHGDN